MCSLPSGMDSTARQTRMARIVSVPMTAQTGICGVSFFQRLEKLLEWFPANGQAEKHNIPGDHSPEWEVHRNGRARHVPQRDSTMRMV